MASRVAICIPWRDIGDPSRTAAHRWVRNWLSDIGFDDVIHGSGPSRAAMCNDAARKAIKNGADVLFFLDADTWIPGEQLFRSVELARESDLLVHAFTRYVRIDQRTTKRLQSRSNWSESALIGQRSTTKHVSGASAISVDLWNRLGGFDERFTTYGAEDRCLHLAAESLGGFVERIEGPAFHWWHSTDPNKAIRPRKDDPRVRLIERYCRAAGYVPDYGQLGRLGASGVVTLGDSVGSQEAMIEVLSEPGGPLSSVPAEQVV